MSEFTPRVIECNSVLENVATAIAGGYHGRPSVREYVLGEATGGLVFVGCAREAVRAIQIHFQRRADEARFMSDRDAYYVAIEDLNEVLATHPQEGGER